MFNLSYLVAPRDPPCVAPHDPQFGTRLRQQRLTCGLSQVELAGAAGLPQLLIWSLEAGRATTSLARVTTLTRILGVSPQWLLTGEEERTHG